MKGQKQERQVSEERLRPERRREWVAAKARERRAQAAEQLEGCWSLTGPPARQMMRQGQRA
jgi:hypothetical protein